MRKIKEKIMLFLMAVMMIIAVTACGHSESGGQDTDRSASSLQSKKDTNGKALVVYFSYADNTDIDKVHSEEYDSLSSASVTKVKGKRYGNNTLIAKWISEKTGAEIFSIKTAKKYTSDYEDVVEVGQDELDSGERLELASHVDDIDQYGDIYLVYPIWWSELPMAVQSFLDEYDLSDKNIYAVITSGGSGESGTLDAIREQEPDAYVSDDYLDVAQEDVGGSEKEVKKWAASVIK